MANYNELRINHTTTIPNITAFMCFKNVRS